MSETPTPLSSGTTSRILAPIGETNAAASLRLYPLHEIMTASIVPKPLALSAAFIRPDGEIAEQRGFYMQAAAVYGLKRFSARYEICLFVLPRQSAADQTSYAAYPKYCYFHLRVLQSFCCQAVTALIINRSV